MIKIKKLSLKRFNTSLLNLRYQSFKPKITIDQLNLPQTIIPSVYLPKTAPINDDDSPIVDGDELILRTMTLERNYKCLVGEGGVRIEDNTPALRLANR